MTERDATFAALDKAYQEHVGKLFAVLTQASDADMESGLAIKRFRAGLERARAVREAALACVSS
jgi:hypothetical protein